MKTLIIVDVQNDYIPEGSLEVPIGDKIIPGFNTVSPNTPTILNHSSI